MSTLKTGALRGTSGTADSVQLHASNQSVTFPGAVTITGALTSTTTSLAGGKVLQWVSGRYTDDRETTDDTSNFVAIPDGLSITPTATSSRILILATINLSKDNSATSKMDFARTISGGSTTLSLSGASDGLTSWQLNGFLNMHLSWVDHPNTTTSTLYQICIKAGGGTVHLNDYSENTGSSMTLLELGPNS